LKELFGHGEGLETLFSKLKDRTGDLAGIGGAGIPKSHPFSEYRVQL
jgi:hypothetical protein